MSDDFISRKDVQFYAMTIIKELEKLYNTGCLGISGLDWRVLMEKILSVDDLLAADVVPVVKCKDCKHYKDGWCYNPNTYDDEKTRGNTDPDWYCADGERRE